MNAIQDSRDSAVASGGGALPRMCFQGFGGYSPTFAGNYLDCLNVSQRKR